MAIQKVFVVGVGMTRFEKPGRRQNVDYTDDALEACTKALMDANLDFDAVEYATAGYCYGIHTLLIVPKVTLRRDSARSTNSD